MTSKLIPCGAQLWFLTLFSHQTVPYTLNGRIWDQMLLLGPEVLFRVALAVLKLAEAALLASRDQDALIKVLHKAPCAGSCDMVLAVAWSVGLDAEETREIDNLAWLAAPHD